MDFYLYYKNEGHKYKADLIIISHAEDDIRQNFAAHTTFQNVELKNNTVHLKGLHIDFQASSKVSKIIVKKTTILKTF